MKLRLPLAAGTGFLVASIFAAPLLPAVYLAFATVCHQAPERCFHIHGIPLPVCARCLGIYVGAFAASLVPLRARATLLGALLAANALQLLTGFGGAPGRLILAFAFCWPGISALTAQPLPDGRGSESHTEPRA